MKVEKKLSEIKSSDINRLLLHHTANLMSEFYEMQSAFLTGIYKRYKNIESANIILCLAQKMHLEIMRQREKKLNHDISLKNFWNNFNTINRPSQKIVSISSMTGIPKETVRRKLKLLLRGGYVLINRCNEYRWCCNKNHQEVYRNLVKRFLLLDVFPT